MTTEQLPLLEIYIQLQETGDLNSAKTQAETVKNQLETLAEDLKLEISTTCRYLSGKTSKKTFEKLFQAELKYDIDLDYSSTQKIWIPLKQATVPESFKNSIKEIGLDYW